MKKYFIGLGTLLCITLTGCSYNGQAYFGEDSGQYYLGYEYFGEDLSADEKILYKDAYQTDMDYLLDNFDNKVVSAQNVEEIKTYDFIDTSITMIKNGETSTYNGADVDTEESSNGENSKDGKDVVEYARKFLGNPYVHGGTSLTNGADCSGYVLSIYAHFGYTLDRTADAQYLMCKNKKKTCRLVKEKDLQAGDLIFYLCPGTTAMRHVAIYTGENSRVHASSSTTGIIESSGLGGSPHSGHTDTLYFGRVLK